MSRKYYINESKLAALYQFKIVFYQLTPDIRSEVKPDETVNLTRNGASVDINAMRPKKILTFKRSISVPVERGPDGYTNLLICTSSLSSYYSPMSSEEESEMRGLKITGEVRNEGGAIDSFCGIISLTGEMVYQFRFAEVPPKKMLAPVGITADGRKAAVMIGEKTRGEDGAGYYIGRPRELLVWTSDNKVQKRKLNYPSTTDEQVKRDFFFGKF